jgi:hypothetical protein
MWDDALTHLQLQPKIVFFTAHSSSMYFGPAAKPKLSSPDLDSRRESDENDDIP